ncbi:hypothetical protein B5M42_010445 [Paenibacillus athensensis]|uniref:Uncharacterized protein n=1 Tax=Paenibacillus athensensis TaxID=1967502 RepID=A0A4Y8Q4B9_9BACL|nr:hypothetical protein [Paenibacillus athensensis]MCD1259256.1 hypothetical protein [Paenibacillus athensensis]
MSDSYLRTLLGQYGFTNFFSLDVIENNPNFIFYTEVHEYMHTRLTLTTPYGFYVYLLNACEKYDDTYAKFRLDLVDKMRFVQEAFATFHEMCYLHIKEGKEQFSHEVGRLKSRNKEYYSYYESLAFLLDDCGVEEAAAVSAWIANLSMNVAVVNIPVHHKERKKWLSHSENAQRYLPNSRFKKICKMMKKVLAKEPDATEQFAKWFADYNETFTDFQYDDTSINKIKSFVLQLYAESAQLDPIKAIISTMYNFNLSKYDTFLSHPTLLNKQPDLSSYTAEPNWLSLFGQSVDARITFISLFSIIKQGVTAFHVSHIVHNKVASYVSYVEDDKLAQLLMQKPNTLVLLGQKARAYQFYQTYALEHAYQFIDHALVDSVAYINQHFAGGRFRVFNYQNRFSVLLLSDGKLKVLQPVSIHAIDQIREACRSGFLQLAEAEKNDLEFDPFLIKNAQDKRELDVIVSLLFFNW